jgi:hypothetical protein
LDTADERYGLNNKQRTFKQRDHTVECDALGTLNIHFDEVHAIKIAQVVVNAYGINLVRRESQKSDDQPY